MKKLTLILLVISALFIMAAKKPNKGGIAGYEIVQNSSSIPLSGLENIEVYCPDGKLVLGGGVNLDGGVKGKGTVIYTHPDPGGLGWLASVRNNNSPVPIQVIVYAICADASLDYPPPPTITPLPPTDTPEPTLTPLPPTDTPEPSLDPCAVMSITNVIIGPGSSAFYLTNSQMQIIDITRITYSWAAAGPLSQIDLEPEILMTFNPAEPPPIDVNSSQFNQMASIGFGTRALIFRFAVPSPTTAHTLTIELDGLCSIRTHEGGPSD